MTRVTTMIMHGMITKTRPTVYGVKQNHRKYVAFGKLRDEDRENYWRWRHDHDDAALKIVIK